MVSAGFRVSLRVRMSKMVIDASGYGYIAFKIRDR